MEPGATHTPTSASTPAQTWSPMIRKNSTTRSPRNPRTVVPRRRFSGQKMEPKNGRRLLRISKGGRKKAAVFRARKLDREPAGKLRKASASGRIFLAVTLDSGALREASPSVCWQKRFILDKNWPAPTWGGTLHARAVTRASSSRRCGSCCWSRGARSCGPCYARGAAIWFGDSRQGEHAAFYMHPML